VIARESGIMKPKHISKVTMITGERGIKKANLKLQTKEDHRGTSF